MTQREHHFGDLLERNRRILASIARNFAHSDRDDLEQDIALALWHALPSYRGDCAESTFVYRVALNTALLGRRRNRTIPVTTSPEALDQLVDPGLRPDQAAEARESEAQLVAALATLTPVDRALMVLHRDGCSYREIAAVLGITETNVGARLTRTRARLKTHLERSPR